MLTLLFTASLALASDACVALCSALDAAEETCEAAYGDGGFCETIGTLEETCDPEDGGTTASCEGLCGSASDLVGTCEGTYGAEDPTCTALAAIADDCADGSYDGPVVPSTEGPDDAEEEDGAGLPAGANAACASVPAGRAGWLAGLITLAALGRRRR